MKLPICLIGYVRDFVRLEACGGADRYWLPLSGWLFNFKPALASDGNLYAITHLQKRSKFGFLLVQHEAWYQLCFHIWFTFKYQQQMANGGWIPGTETVFYWRVGWSRWAAGACQYVHGEIIKIGKWSVKVPWGTFYGPGLHWD